MKETCESVPTHKVGPPGSKPAHQRVERRLVRRARAKCAQEEITPRERPSALGAHCHTEELSAQVGTCRSVVDVAQQRRRKALLALRRAAPASVDSTSRAEPGRRTPATRQRQVGHSTDRRRPPDAGRVALPGSRTARYGCAKGRWPHLQPGRERGLDVDVSPHRGGEREPHFRGRAPRAVPFHAAKNGRDAAGFDRPAGADA